MNNHEKTEKGDGNMFMILRKKRIKRKISKLCKKMQEKMSLQDTIYCIGVIKSVLRELPESKKEGLLDVCLGVLKDV